MKLLITTQVVDKTDPVLGFFHRWIEEFARHCESIEVICLKEGEHALPVNVHVHSLGKENGSASGITYAFRFIQLVWKLRNTYDTVFVHMNPEYIVLAGWFWRVTGKKVSLWYLHKSVTLRLRLAEIFTNVIFTASPESFRLKTPKLKIVGHGIDLDQFKSASHNKSGVLEIITTGRVAPAKRIMEMLAALDVLHARGIPFHFTIAGGPGTPADIQYAQELERAISDRAYHTQVSMLGAVSHDQVPALLSEADVFLNLSTTGSMDKAVLEAFAEGVAVVTSNEAFHTQLESDNLFISENNPEVIADALVRASHIETEVYRKYVEQTHSLSTLIPRILDTLKVPYTDTHV